MNRFTSTVQQSAIREIVKEIAKGNTCYMDRYTSKITIIDNSIEDVEEIAAQKQTEIEIENKIENYVKLNKLSEKIQLMIMKDFLDEIVDKSVRKELSNSLKRKSPIRNFTREIESNMGLNQHWENYNGKESERWVTNILIDAYNY
ncbi:MAG TPA: hypothetical protein DCW83_09990 [Saprospirales bacterium]|jgi:hypothetical protein|nr:hypothetical protein [Saprospirales bacterium]